MLNADIGAVVDVTDRKFAVKARLCQSLGVSIAVIRSYLHSPKVLQSAVCVLKLYATDGRSVYFSLSVCLWYYACCMSLFTWYVNVVCIMIGIQATVTYGTATPHDCTKCNS